MLTLCFATNNAHKLTEIQALLGNGITLKTLGDIGCNEELPEEQDTIAGNSWQKAAYVWEKYGVDTFADDSGLEVDALNGEPGVDSAHYAGPQRDASDNIVRVWQRLGECHTPMPAPAHFRTVITLVRDGVFQQFEGLVPGTIIDKKRGEGGFGYDPVFVPDGQERTFAQMSLAEKGEISHRARAFSQLAAFLKR